MKIYSNFTFMAHSTLWLLLGLWKWANYDDTGTFSEQNTKAFWADTKCCPSTPGPTGPPEVQWTGWLVFYATCPFPPTSTLSAAPKFSYGPAKPWKFWRKCGASELTNWQFWSRRRSGGTYANSSGWNWKILKSKSPIVGRNGKTKVTWRNLNRGDKRNGRL